MLQQEYWPFEFPPPDQRSPDDQLEFEFLEVSYRHGFRPCRIGTRDFCALSNIGREGVILERGRTIREIVLSANGTRVLSAFLSDFRAASNAIFAWLQNESVEFVVAQLQPHLVTMPGVSYKLRRYDVPI